MLSIEDIEPGSNVVHKNTGLRYAVVDVSDTEVLLSPESDATMQDLMVPVELFLAEFIPMPPDGLVTDRVIRNVEEARQAPGPGPFDHLCPIL